MDPSKMSDQELPEFKVIPNKKTKLSKKRAEIAAKVVNEMFNDYALRVAFEQEVKKEFLKRFLYGGYD